MRLTKFQTMYKFSEKLNVVKAAMGLVRVCRSLKFLYWSMLNIQHVQHSVTHCNVTAALGDLVSVM
jgi:hypothetical protein